MDGLASRVNSWARRAKLQRSLWWLFFGLAAGLALGLLLAIAARVWPLMSSTALTAICVVLALLGTFVALAWPWLRNLRTPVLTWSRAFDQQFGLRQRISTALEASDGALAIKSDAIRVRLQQDASRVADSVDARKLLPLRLSWRAGVTSLVLLAALALALALPNAQEQVLAAQNQFQQSLEQQAQQIEQAKQQIQQSKALTDAQKQQALQALNEAQTALNDPNTTPEKALAAINDAQSKLDAMRDQEAQQRQADLQNAGESLAADELTNALANSLANQNFQQAAQQMRNLTSSQQGQSLTPEESQRVADQLDQLARQMQTSEPAMAQQLREAAEQMRQGNMAAAQQALEQAAQSLDQVQQTQQANQELQQAQSQAEAARQSVAQANQQVQQSQPSQQANPNNQNNQAGQNANTQANAAQATAQASSQAASQAASQNSSQASSQQQSSQGQQGEGQQAGGQQPGQAENGSQLAQAGQAGQSGSPGESQGGVPGEGSTGTTTQGGIAQGSSQQSGHSEDTGSENSVYAPGRVGNQGEQVVLDDPQGQVAPDPNGSKNTAPQGQSTVPYQAVYSDYAKSADEAIQKDEVPPELRDYVRDYFSSLDPKNNR